MAAILNMATGFFRAYGFARVALSYRAMRGKAVRRLLAKSIFQMACFSVVYPPYPVNNPPLMCRVVPVI
jgi:hypothetical protein